MRLLVVIVTLTVGVFATPAVYLRKASNLGYHGSGVLDRGEFQQQQIAPGLGQQQMFSHPSFQGDITKSGGAKTIDLAADPENVRFSGIMTRGDSMQQQQNLASNQQQQSGASFLGGGGMQQQNVAGLGGQQQNVAGLGGFHRKKGGMKEKELLITKPGVERIDFNELEAGRIVKLKEM